MTFHFQPAVSTLGRLFVGAAVATLTACSGGGSQAPSTQVLPNVPFSALQSVKAAVPRRSWMSADAKKAALLYADEEAGDGFVNIYDQKGHDQAPIGQIVGLQYPVGLYVDDSKNLYVANSNAFNVPIYKRGATTPFKTLSDPGEYPYGVASDSKGTIFVASAITTNHTAGNVAVYAGGSVNPTSFLSDQKWFSALAVTTDSHDNVFVCFDLAADPNQFGVDEFPAGKTTPVDLGLRLAHSCDSIVKDAHNNLVVSDQGAKTIDVFPPGSKSPSHTFGLQVAAAGITFGSSFKNIYAGGSLEVDEYTYPAGRLVDTITKGFRSDFANVVGVAAER